MTGSTHILLVEDDEDDFVITRDLLDEALGQVDLRWEKTYQGGLDGLRSGPFDACLLDYRLGAQTGLQLLLEARDSGVHTPIILLTGTTGGQLDSEILQAGAADYLVKGELTAPQLARAIRYAKERAHHLEAMRRSQREFRDVIERLPACIMIRQGDTLVYANPATAAATGYEDTKALIGKSFFDFVHPSCHDILRERIVGAQPPSARELMVFRADGTTMLIETAPEHIPITFEGAPAFLTSIRDITEEKRTKELLEEYAEEMQARSLTDELTQLHNRRGFLAAGNQHLKMAVRSKKPAVVLFMDLDGLKGINDELGHEAGDAAIRQTARLLRSSFRDVDILSRLGGDEFVVLLVDCEHAEVPLGRLARNLEACNEKPGQAFRLSISTGAARFDPLRPEGLEVLMRQADSAMYEQKRMRRHPARDAAGY